MRMDHSLIQFASPVADAVLKVFAGWLETGQCSLQKTGCSPCTEEFAVASLASLGSSPKHLLLGPVPDPRGPPQQGSGRPATLGALSGLDWKSFLCGECWACGRWPILRGPFVAPSLPLLSSCSNWGLARGGRAQWMGEQSCSSSAIAARDPPGQQL